VSNNFVWVPTNASSLQYELLNRQVVIGGHEDGGNVVVGRISYEGGTQIGKANTFPVGDSHFRWADANNNEATVPTYQVLVFQKW
jgi:hypothetical protein